MFLSFSSCDVEDFWRRTIDKLRRLILFSLWNFLFQNWSKINWECFGLLDIFFFKGEVSPYFSLGLWINVHYKTFFVTGQTWTTKWINNGAAVFCKSVKIDCHAHSQNKKALQWKITSQYLVPFFLVIMRQPLNENKLSRDEPDSKLPRSTFWQFRCLHASSSIRRARSRRLRALGRAWQTEREVSLLPDCDLAKRSGLGPWGKAGVLSIRSWPV